MPEKKKELTPEELAQFIAENKRQREEEFLKIMNEASKRLRVNADAIIESHGTTAVARILVKAE